MRDIETWRAEDLRPFRYWGVMGSLWYRVMATPIPVIALAAELGIHRMLSTLILTGGLLVVYVIAALTLSPSVLSDRHRTTSILVADTAVVVAVNVFTAASLDVSFEQYYWVVLWPLLQGTVAMWLAVYGVTAGYIAVVAAAPLFLIMVIVNPGTTWQEGAPHLLEHALWLLLAVGVAHTVNYLLRSRAMAAVAEGIHEGTEAERVRSLRLMHDTALQALEAIALLSSNTRMDDEQRRALIASTAQLEARQLREILDREKARRGSFYSDVARLVELESHRGTPIRLWASNNRSVVVPTALHDALCDALREILTNVRQHSGARSATVRLRTTQGYVRLDIEDDGVGFAADHQSLGFGLRESVYRRVDHAGGRVFVKSTTGRGTTVSMSATWRQGTLADRRQAGSAVG